MTDQEYDHVLQEYRSVIPHRTSTDERYQQTLLAFRDGLGLSTDASVPNPILARPDQNRRLIQAATQMLGRYPASHFFTLTYFSKNGSFRREAAVAEWLDAIEWLQRRPLAYLVADEESPDFWTGMGMPGQPSHHHGILFGARHLTSACAEHLWHADYGDALVEPFESGGNAIPYVLKQALRRSKGEWYLGGRFDRLQP